MPLTQVIGWRGSGKTIFLLLMALKYSMEVGKEIHANFSIKVSNFIKLKLTNLLYYYHEKMVLGDEFYGLANARRSMSILNIFLEFVVLQLRKTRTNIFITVQQLRTVDVIYRDEWDYRVYCDRVSNGHKNWRHWDFVFEIHCKRTGTHSTKLFTYESAKKYFALYNTNEIVVPKFQSRIEHEILSGEKGELMKRAKEILEIVRNDIKKPTLKAVKYALMNNDFHPIWGDVVHLELTEG